MIEQTKDLSSNIEERISQLEEIIESVWNEPFKIRNVKMIKITLGQAILESAILKPTISGLALRNNLFGIKARLGDKSVAMTTIEHLNGQDVSVVDKFATFKTIKECVESHKALLSRPRYASVLNSATIESACRQLEVCGYATDIAYHSKLLTIINKYLSNV